MKYDNYSFKARLQDARETGNLNKFLAENPYEGPGGIERALPEGFRALSDREVLFVMTDSGVDREGDMIASAGMSTDQFASKGSILWGHRADKPEFVLGHPAEVIKEETRILTVASFLDAAANPTADRVLRMIRANGVRAMSVGLMVLEYSEASDRGGFMPLNIVRSETIEASVTPVPVNPRAVALSAGGSAEEAKAITELLEEATETPEELEASKTVTALTEDEIKDLVLRTVKELKSRENTTGRKDVPSVLSYLARGRA